jgi:hypothetical protein
MRVSTPGRQHTGRQLSTDAKFPAPCLPVTWEESLQAVAGKTLENYKNLGMDTASQYGLRCSTALFRELVVSDFYKYYDRLLQPKELLTMSSELAMFCTAFRKRHDCDVPDRLIRNALRQASSLTGEN